MKILLLFSLWICMIHLVAATYLSIALQRIMTQSTCFVEFVKQKFTLTMFVIDAYITFSCGPSFAW